MNLNILVSINAATLIAIVIFGYKVVKFIDRIEFKTDMMWTDYERRTKISYATVRSTDELQKRTIE